MASTADAENVEAARKVYESAVGLTAARKAVRASIGDGTNVCRRSLL